MKFILSIEEVSHHETIIEVDSIEEVKDCFAQGKYDLKRDVQNSELSIVKISLEIHSCYDFDIALSTGKIKKNGTDIRFDGSVIDYCPFCGMKIRED